MNHRHHSYRSLSILAFAVLTLFLTGCKQKEAVEWPEYIAVKEMDAERWSIMRTSDATIVVDQEFSGKPSAISPSGIFSVENSSGTYDYYSIENVNSPINSESYVEATPFYDDEFALTVTKGECIKVINKNCEVTATFDKSVACIRTPFDKGVAAYKDINGQWGLVNKDGTIVVRAKYADCSMASVKDGRVVMSGKGERDSTLYVLDYTGKELFQYPLSKYRNLVPHT